MEDYGDLHLVDHDRTTCATCRARRGEAMVCAICQTPLTPDEVVVLCYTSKETPHHLGSLHASCSASIDDGVADDRFIHY